MASWTGSSFSSSTIGLKIGPSQFSLATTVHVTTIRNFVPIGLHLEMAPIKFPNLERSLTLMRAVGHAVCAATTSRRDGPCGWVDLRVSWERAPRADVATPFKHFYSHSMRLTELSDCLQTTWIEGSDSLTKWLRLLLERGTTFSDATVTRLLCDCRPFDEWKWHGRATVAS